MERFRVQMDENRARFDEGLTSLSAAVRPKFQKLTGTGKGRPSCVSTGKPARAAVYGCRSISPATRRKRTG